jgi:molybdate transport system substrate-binding protein
MRRQIPLLVLLIGLGPARPILADEALVAVAASFLPPMQAVGAAFSAATGHSVRLVTGSTGGLYAQIVNGAPYDVFVAADAQRPRLLEESGHGLAGTRATVALGKLVLLARDPGLVGTLGLEALQSPAVRHIAIANPRLAPYGVAARETLEALGLWQRVLPRLVRGESVAQTFAMIATGNAQLGFVALGQVLGTDRPGAYVLVPDAYYTAIHQDMIVLAHARDNPAARAVREFLLSAAGTDIIRAHGYATEGF